MRNFKLFLLTAVVAASTFFIYSCAKENEFKEQETNLEVELRKCPWCVAEDVLGMAEGGGIGFWMGGPMGAAIGGALVGTYRSYKQFHGYKPNLNNNDFDGYLQFLATKYDYNSFINDEFKIGLLHNKMLNNLINNGNVELNRVDAYNEMSKILKLEIQNYFISENLELKVLELMSNIDNNSSNPLPEKYQELFNKLDEAFDLETNEELISVLNHLTVLFSNDQVGLQAINTTYHTYHFWKNLKLYRQ